MGQWLVLWLNCLTLNKGEKHKGGTSGLNYPDGKKWPVIVFTYGQGLYEL